MAKQKVFISYDHSEDVIYKRLLAAWDANSNFEFEFDDRSPGTAINSTNASVIKAALTTKIKAATHILVIVGAKTYTSDWVTWEIDRAKQSDASLKLVAIKLDKSYTTPPGLLGANTSWAMSFNHASIIKALNDA